MTIQINRLLITGAAGALGTVLRRHYQGRFPVLRLSDRVSMGDQAPGEEHVVCDLGDAEAVERAFEGVDACVHLGGQPVEAHVEAPRGVTLLWAGREIVAPPGDTRLVLTPHGPTLGRTVLVPATVNGAAWVRFSEVP